MKRKRVAVYGGSFNPIHKGHIALAKHILANEIADQVMFMPVADPPHKDDRELAPYNERCEMIALAIKDIPYFENDMTWSTLEADLPKPSFTLFTLDALSSRMLNKEFAWVIGADELINLHAWRPDPIRLVRSYDFIAYLRHGVAVDLAELNEHWPGWICQKLLAGVVYDAKIPDISATDIRRELKSMGYYSRTQPNSKPKGLSRAVYEYIVKHNLYREES